MVLIQRVVFSLMIPLNLCCIAWVWLGRATFGAAGWWMVIITFTILPVMLVGLCVTTVLAFVQRVPAERGRITRAQTLAQLGVWGASLGFGFFLVDFTDETNSERSVFTAVAGRNVENLSYTLTWVCMLAAVACYALLLALLIGGFHNRPSRTGPRSQDAARP